MDDKKNEIIISDNVGVKYYSGNRDDIKTKALQLFSQKARREKSKNKKVFWALDEISFKGYNGEIIGIIGSNGAGKTTISKVISRIIREDVGLMQVDGNVTALFSFGMGFNKELTGRENVYLNGMMLGIEKEVINQYIDEIHEFSDLEEFMDQPMKYYSSGMKARLGFSVASHLEPEILILDEALNTGDAKFSKKAASRMKELVKKAKAVILVTHSLAYAQRHCDRLIWLQKGKVAGDGDPEAIVEAYRASLPKVAPKKKRILQIEKTETVVKKNTVIEAKNLGVCFKLNNQNKFWALRNLNIKINEGEVIGIIGHNGAGKSTLCKVLTNIYKPDEGHIKVEGRTSALLGYGTGFNPHLSGKDNIFLNAMLLGIPKKVVFEKYDEIVDFSGIKSAIDKPVKQYSSGMKSRLGFSIAAVLKPDIFIVDEALSTGDIAFQEKASARIQEMIDGAKAVIIVSHSMPFVEKVCTRAIWMEKGTIKFDGNAEEAVAKYREASNK